LKEPKITFHIVTAFPEAFSYLFTSILKRAQENKIIKIKIHDIKDFTNGNIDDRPYGGGPGMVLKAEPILRAIENILKKSKFEKKERKIIFFDLKGKNFDQKMANYLKKFKELILICGHYEGVDERVAKISDIKISVGNFILSGGEIPAMILVDSISRLLPGVLNNPNSLEEKRNYFSFPVYTRPEKLKFLGKILKVPKVLLKGNHLEIKKWREKKGKFLWYN
jgi:tRNA (guanine37-N1)-methyltransferase